MWSRQWSAILLAVSVEVKGISLIPPLPLARIMVDLINDFVFFTTKCSNFDFGKYILSFHFNLFFLVNLLILIIRIQIKKLKKMEASYVCMFWEL